jgi:hypothetical protein
MAEEGGVAGVAEPQTASGLGSVEPADGVSPSVVAAAGARVGTSFLERLPFEKLGHQKQRPVLGNVIVQHVQSTRVPDGICDAPAALERGQAPSRRPKAPTTDRPVEVSLGPAGRAHGSEQGRIGAAAVGGFVIAGVLAAGIVGFARSGHTHSVTAAGVSVAPSGVTVALPAPSSAPPPALSPEASVPELDTPVVPKAPAVPAPVSRSRHDQAPPANCVPPYTMDPETGIKRWRVECL